jgi:hypothetical protein
MRLEFKKDTMNIRFILERVDPQESIEVIDEAHVVWRAISRAHGRTPDISVHQLQGSSGNRIG